jgi:demethylmenaquinone methyltransferase/2-methoxy-6-polyprenyl-1,4-benzoquinol methylase
MNEYSHDKVVPYKDSELSKKAQVANMFDDIAVRYDFLNRFLSAGIDLRWRKKGLKLLQKVKPTTILDVATGTGDLAILAANILNPQKIIGIDISEGMLKVAREKIIKNKLESIIEIQHGDSESINFDDNSFDAVMVSFGVRNFQNLTLGLTEIKRVLKPNGMLMILEFSQPKLAIVRSFYDFYMKLVTPNMGKLFSKNRDAYAYLDESIKKFPEGENFIDILNKLGYKKTYFKKLSLGICSIYCGEK